MKKLGFIMLLVFVMSMNLSAQTDLYFNVSAAIPVSDYAYGYNEKTCALLSDRGWGGGAGIGANFDVKIKFNIGVKGLGLFLSFDGFYNGLSQEMKDYFDDMRYQLLQETDGTVSIETPHYLNISAMGGFNYVYKINQKLGIFGEAGIGANLRNISQLYMGVLEWSPYFDAFERVNYDSKNSLAFQIGAGFEINNRFVLGVSFYHLGSAGIQGSDYTCVGDLNYSDSDTEYFRSNDIAPMLIMARMGVKL